jgi:CheY-like chemotaxis protein
MTQTPSPARVLLVDDDPRILAGLRRQLHRRYHVHTAQGGEQALEMVAPTGPESFAVVLSDMRMPVMDGATFLARVRMAAPYATRVLLTGQTDSSAAIRAVNDAQIFRFLTKPCSPEVLDRCLRDAVVRHHVPDRPDDRRVRADLVMRYRPVIDLASGRPVAVKAFVVAADSVPRTPIDLSSTGWMIAAACEEIASWPPLGAAEPLRLLIEVSAAAVTEAGFTALLTRALALSGLDPDRVTLEPADGVLAGGFVSDTGVRVGGAVSGHLYGRPCDPGELLAHLADLGA